MRNNLRFGAVALAAGVLLLACDDDEDKTKQIELEKDAGADTGSPDAATSAGGKVGAGGGSTTGGMSGTGGSASAGGKVGAGGVAAGGAGGATGAGGSSEDGAACVSEKGSCAAGETCCDGLMCCAGVPVPEGEEYCGTTCPRSDRNIKRDFASIDPDAVLEQVASLPISTWSYRTEAGTVRHMGPMAQDFQATFGIGGSDKDILQVDADGVALASIQALNRRLTALENENRRLRDEVARQRELPSAAGLAPLAR